MISHNIWEGFTNGKCDKCGYQLNIITYHQCLSAQLQFLMIGLRWDYIKQCFVSIWSKNNDGEVTT